MLVKYGPEPQADKVGFTNNFDAMGLFVQTAVVAAPRRVLKLEVHGPTETFHLRARVVWAKRVPPQLIRTFKGGMGLRLIDPSPAWLDFCSTASSGL